MKRHALCDWPEDRSVRECDLFNGTVLVLVEYRDRSSRQVRVCMVHAEAARLLSTAPLFEA